MAERVDLPDPVDLPPARFAELVAPAIDRVFVAAMASCRTGGGVQVSQRYGGAAAVGPLVEFRTRLAHPGGTVTAAGLAAVTRYRDPEKVRSALAGSVAHGMLTIGPAGEVCATALGHAYLDEIYAGQATVLEPLWLTTPAERVARLLAELDLVLATALGTGGATLAAMAPPYRPPAGSPAVELLNLLGTLRYHRADAHAAAWLAAGRTAAEMVTLAPGPARTAIERDTNERAASAFTVLPAERRLVLLADLAALPA